MSSVNYDLEYPITYNPAYKHYLCYYEIKVPYYKYNSVVESDAGGVRVVKYTYYQSAAVSFDDGAEETVSYEKIATVIGGPGGTTVIQPTSWYATIPSSGYYSKLYLRNPNRNLCTFTNENSDFRIVYQTKAAFEIKFNMTGFVANTNAWFKCSTVQKDTLEQYSWVSATVYYKESTDSTYQSVSGVLSGTWSDMTVSTNLSFADGHTYDIYIEATADDGSVAVTSTAQFGTTDGIPVSTCVSPSGSFEEGSVTFVWAHATEYGTPQYAYDLQYSINNGASWTTLDSHVLTSITTRDAVLNDAGTYLWRIRTYNTNDVSGEWGMATFVNEVPALPPSNVVVNTKGRPTVEWASTSQAAYQVQVLLNGSVVYDSEAVYSQQTSHLINQYFNDAKAYTVRIRIYNALGDVSEWVEAGYQQPEIGNVEFTVEVSEMGGAVLLNKTTNPTFVKFYVLRNNKLIAQFNDETYTDYYGVGTVNYSIVGVTSDDQSDIQSANAYVVYPHATIIDKTGQQYSVNKRVDNAYEIQTTNEADINQVTFFGDSLPTHYQSKMRLKSFSISLFDDQGISESIVGEVVFYADNFGNGGFCVVKSYNKTDNFIKNSQGVYANEVSLTLEVTNYDDSIEYPI